MLEFKNRLRMYFKTHPKSVLISFFFHFIFLLLSCYICSIALRILVSVNFSIHTNTNTATRHTKRTQFFRVVVVVAIVFILVFFFLSSPQLTRMIFDVCAERIFCWCSLLLLFSVFLSLTFSCLNWNFTK